MEGRSREASVRICGFGHDDFQYKLKLLEGVSRRGGGRMSRGGGQRGAATRRAAPRHAVGTRGTETANSSPAEGREREREGRESAREISEGYKATKLGQFRLVRGRLRFRLDLSRHMLRRPLRHAIAHGTARPPAPSSKFRSNNCTITSNSPMHLGSSKSRLPTRIFDISPKDLLPATPHIPSLF